jgi:FlaA1/EpsC-like NDP-sugar epimerase
VHKFGPRELVLLDRDESGLHAVQLSIYGTGLLDTPDMVLCDIRDAEALDEVFARHRPDVVFHAAALKHLPMLEQYPDEGWKTNVQGTLNVLQAAERYGCAKFVNISTDKAADPTSVLGKTKRLAERLTAWYAQRSDGTYLSVRFGNVLGSRGSMLHTFLSQIQAGGPVTVTHPEITRYFMTIPEACELTIQAAAIGEDGEVLVLDMGEPVKILDVAKCLVARTNAKVDIVFTGLRHGEKMHEALLGREEQGERKFHPRISHVPVPTLDPAELPFAPESLELALGQIYRGQRLADSPAQSGWPVTGAGSVRWRLAEPEHSDL